MEKIQLTVELKRLLKTRFGMAKLPFKKVPQVVREKVEWRNATEVLLMCVLSQYG